MTIHGAAVHIGKGGKIDKGPAELMSKTENGAHAAHHDLKAHAHGEAAQGKGAKHPDTAAHKEAEKHHIEASGHFKSSDYHASVGNMKAARAEHEAGHASAEKARLAGVAASKNEPSDTGAFEKPSAHKALHADAEDDVKGSEKHEAEHKRLLGEYGKSKNKWEREAVNQQIAKNADEGAKASAQTKHHKALQASAHAKNTDNPNDHKVARSAIDAAREAHERAGGEGSKAKIKELDAMRKPHHAAAEKADKDNPSTSSAYVSRHSKLEDAQKMQMQQDKPSKVFHHPEGGYFVAQHAKASGKYEAAGHKVALDYNGKPPAGPSGGMRAGSSQYHSAQHAHHTAQAEQAAKAGKPDLEAAHKEAADAHWEVSTAIAQGKQGSAGHAMTKAKAAERTVAKHGGNNGPSALAKIAARTAKKVAEEAADQDPKHKK